MPLVCRVGFKPTSTIVKPQQSVRKNLEEIDFELKKGRHDPCVGVRAGVTLESRLAIELMNAVLMHQAGRIDAANFGLFQETRSTARTPIGLLKSIIMTDATSNITLTGFMGTGKSTVGRLLAERLDRPFVDMDEQLEAHFGKSIAEVFADEGEPAFRLAEIRLCTQLAEQQGLVISTGGGALVNPDSRHALAESGPVICLTASLDQILARIGQAADRPLLPGRRWMPSASAFAICSTSAGKPMPRSRFRSTRPIAPRMRSSTLCWQRWTAMTKLPT